MLVLLKCIRCRIISEIVGENCMLYRYCVYKADTERTSNIIYAILLI